MPDALWRLEGVGLDGAPLPRLRDVSLEIRRGVTAVLGCSGSGKTSLLNLLVGFERPDHGTVTAGLPKSEGKLPLYWVPATGGLWPHLTVEQHLAMVNPSGARDADAIRDMLSRFDLGAKLRSRPDELSQGERSRLALARALFAHPAVLVMDEPLVSVDTARSGRFWRIVRECVETAGASLVYATHFPHMVVGEAERVVCLREGRVLYVGSVDALYDYPPSREAAECLGETNWLHPEESWLWFGRETNVARSYRPEQIAVIRDDSGPAVIVSSRFKGAFAETEVRQESGDVTRTFAHRPCRDGFAPGARVIVKLLLALLMLCGMSNCSRRVEARLEFSRVEVWRMPAQKARIPAPRGMAVGFGGEVYVLDTAGRVLVFGPGGRLLRQWDMPESADGNPEGLCILRDGRVAVADTHYHRVMFFDQLGNVLSMFGREGRAPGEFIFPVDIVQDDAENIYVCEYGSNDRIQKFRPDGSFVKAFGGFGLADGEFQRPSGMVWRQGKLYIADAINNRIQVFSDAGQFLGILGAPARAPALRFPYEIALGPDDTLYVIEYQAGRVTRLSLEGTVLARWGRTGAGNEECATPWGIAVTPAGRVIVADTGNRRILELIP